MKQFGKILKFELNAYFKNKVFVGVTLMLLFLITVVMFIPRISVWFKSDETSSDSTETSVMLLRIDDSLSSDIIKTAFFEAFSDFNIQITDETDTAIKNKIISGNAECAFIINDSTSYTYYVNNLSMYDMNSETTNEILRYAYQTNVMINSSMTYEQANDAMNIQISGQTTSLGKNQTENFFYTYIMIFALYIVILLYGQMVATNVATEKSSRAMEVLITSANPTSMMFGKVVASCMAGFIQLVAVFGSALISYSVNKTYWNNNMIIDSIFNIPPELLMYMLVFFVLGFFIYAFMFGAVGSTASKLEDINTSVMPITMLFVVAFMAVMTSMSSGNIDNIVMKICSYIPFTSSMAMFTRIAMSTVSWYEIVISILILIVSTIVIGVLSAKIYRVGVLLYGTPPKLVNIIKSVWKA